MKVKGNQGATRDPSMVRGLPLRAGEVTRETFAEKAVAFCRVSGRVDGEHPIIRRDGDELAAWCVWMAFFARLGFRMAFYAKLEALTVPALYPWDFSEDADFLRGEEARLVVNERRHRQAEATVISPQRRKQLADMLRGIFPPEMRVAARRGSRDRRDGKLGDMPKPIDTPIAPLSDEALGKMGVRRPIQHEEAA